LRRAAQNALANPTLFKKPLTLAEYLGARRLPSHCTCSIA
jgi:hypothetical protein